MWIVGKCLQWGPVRKTCNDRWCSDECSLLRCWINTDRFFPELNHEVAPLEGDLDYLSPAEGIHLDTIVYDHETRWRHTDIEVSAARILQTYTTFTWGQHTLLHRIINKSTYAFGKIRTHLWLVGPTYIIIIYHDFLPTPRRGSHVKSGKTHTQSSRYTP